MRSSMCPAAKIRTVIYESMIDDIPGRPKNRLLPSNYAAVKTAVAAPAATLGAEINCLSPESS